MRDFNTHSEADAGRFDRMHNATEDFDGPDASDLHEVSTKRRERMVRCSFGCSTEFIPESHAYLYHMDLHASGQPLDPWAV